MLAQRIFAIAMGYEDLNDHDSLRDDPLLQIVTERGMNEQQPLASASTLCRFENRMDRKTLSKMAEVFVEQFIASHSSPPEQIILDFDATDDPVHGNQEGRFFHGYYDNYCFLPLYVFCGGQLLAAYLRPSKIDAAKHSRAILKLLARRFRQVWPDVRIIVRADSGFCRWRLLRWCDKHAVNYIAGLATNEVLKRLAEPWMRQSERGFERTQLKQRIFADVEYGAATWERKRRVIIKAEHSSQGANPRFVVTNLPGDPHALYDDVYCQRGDMENRIKESRRAGIRRPNELPQIFVKPVEAFAFISRVRAARIAAASWSGRDGTGPCPVWDDSPETFEDRSKNHLFGSEGCTASCRGLSIQTTLCAHTVTTAWGISDADMTA